MKNWKTTSTGLTMILAGIATLYFSGKNNTLNEGTITGAATSVLGGIGLLFAKDYNVTGGTTLNVPNEASIVQAATTTDK